MESLLRAASDLVALLSPDKVNAIADRTRGKTAHECERGLHRLVTTEHARAALDRFLMAWERFAIEGNTLAGILIGACYAREKALHETTTELVWTGPKTPFVPTRRTEQVLLDLIRRAEHELFLVSFVAYDVPTIMDELIAASVRGVEIRILLEASMIHGGSLAVDPIAAMRKAIPSATLYTWLNKVPPFNGGRVHAKVVVADSSAAFLTSANLTGYALERNMEAGIIINGGRIPIDLRLHLHALIATDVIHSV